MKKTTLYMVLAMLCPFLTTAGQTPPTSIGLKIGDDLPDIIITNILNYPTNSAKISDFKGKLLILDFWATWCIPCITMIPRIDSLQKEFLGKVQFLSVAYQSEREIQNFIDILQKRNNKRYNLPEVVNDTALTKLFPHTSLPHFVWINKNGKVKTFTSAYYITRENIRAVLDTKDNDSITPKYDIEVSSPLYSNSHLPLENLTAYHILFKGRIEGVGAGSYHRRSKNFIGLSLTNATLLDLFSNCGDKLINNFSPKNIQVITSDSSQLYFSKSHLSKEEWYRRNVYSIDCIIPLIDSSKLYQEILWDINRYSKFQAAIKQKSFDHYALTVSNKALLNSNENGTYVNSLSDKGIGQLLNAPVYHFISWLNYSFPKWPLIEDKTNLNQKINITLKAPVRSLEDIRKQLNQQGFDLTLTNSPVATMIIEEKPKINKSSK